MKEVSLISWKNIYTAYNAVFMIKGELILAKFGTNQGDNMAVEQTLSIIKPDAVGKNVIGAIEQRFELAGLKIVAMKMLHLSKEQGSAFYAVHKERPFFDDLVEFISSGPVVVQVLHGENAIAENRRIMGATNPQEAEAGTIRADFADSIDANAVHGSDATDTARQEIEFFFQPDEIHVR